MTETTGPQPTATAPVGDAVAVLAMEDTDGTRSYYRVPSTWHAWIENPRTNPPTDLVAAYTVEFGRFPAAGEFAVRTRQVLAVDAHWIGTRLDDVVTAAAGRPIIELHGTWF